MFSHYKDICKRLPVFVLIVFGAWSSHQAPIHALTASKVVSYVDYDCSDFGTKERAQSEFIKSAKDRYGLDADGDGQVCEWNPSGRNWAFFLSGVGLILGRYVGKKKRFGEDGVVPFPKGVLFDWVKDGDGKRTAEFQESNLLVLIFWWVPYFAMTILRDRVYPIDTGPPLLIATCFALGFGLTYWMASTKDRWI